MVEIDLGKPLRRGTKIKLDTEVVWVDFRYEQLPTFCFYCGKVGHQERLCEEKIQDSSQSKILEGQYGEWLRVTGVSVGRKGSRTNPNLGRNMDLGKHLEVREEPRGDRSSSAEEQNIHNLRKVQRTIDDKALIEIEQLGEDGSQEEAQNNGEGDKEGRQTTAEGGKQTVTDTGKEAIQVEDQSEVKRLETLSD